MARWSGFGGRATHPRPAVRLVEVVGTWGWMALDPFKMKGSRKGDPFILKGSGEPLDPFILKGSGSTPALVATASVLAEILAFCSVLRSAVRFCHHPPHLSSPHHVSCACDSSHCARLGGVSTPLRGPSRCSRSNVCYGRTRRTGFLLFEGEITSPYTHAVSIATGTRLQLQH